MVAQQTAERQGNKHKGIHPWSVRLKMKGERYQFWNAVLKKVQFKKIPPYLRSQDNQLGIYLIQ